jgi:prepilin-type N-terminal cleavage/methylation domain-containing protein
VSAPLPLCMQRHGKLRRGYSLVELLVVLAIIGILMALTLSAYSTVVGTANKATKIVSEESLRAAAAAGTPLHIPGPPPTTDKPGYVANQYTIMFDDSVGDPHAQAAKLVADYPGGKVRHVFDFPIFKGCNVFIPGITVDVLKTHAGVKIAQREGRGVWCNPQNGVRRIGFPNAGSRLTPVDPTTMGFPNVTGTLNKSTSIRNMVIAVMDTGIEERHVDLNVKKVFSFGGNTVDEIGHGTFVAGIIGARQNGRGAAGVFPNVPLWSLDVSNVFGEFPDEFAVYAALGFVWGSAAEIRVCNMSFAFFRDDIMNYLVNKCAEAGVIMVAAAGNFFDDAAFYSPGSAEKAICVGAMADSDGRFGGLGPNTAWGRDDRYALFSNFGDTVDVIAPGVDIISSFTFNRLAIGTSTSFAAAHVSGLMGLYVNSTINVPPIYVFGSTRRANGHQIASLFCRQHGVELIRGLFWHDPGHAPRFYPLLIQPTR